ncbi:MAG: F390 synthetase-related protein [Stappiaceae bacterium]
MSGQSGILTALASYARVRLFPHIHRNRSHLESWQKKRLSKWLANDVVKTEAFQHLAGANPELSHLPIMDKADLMEDFARYNIAGVTNEIGWAAFDRSKQFSTYTVGASTGTSGNRGLFVISQRERFAWLGAILAKALPEVWRYRDRVAVLLPISTPLYESANETRYLTLKFFDISAPLESFVADLVHFNPSLLIAPPRVLRMLGEMDIDLSPRRIFSAAEKLDTFDRAIIEARFGEILSEIYMATEGLLAVSCSHGRLHLSEDCMHFELAKEVNGLVSPIISDFSRKTQIIVRYRMNDLLRMDRELCPCGSPLRVVSEIVGRMDDVLQFDGTAEQLVEITPDIVRNVIVDADRSIEDFRLIQIGRRKLELHLPANCSTQTVARVKEKLKETLAIHHAEVPIEIEHKDHLPEDESGKLRRVERRCS